MEDSELLFKGPCEACGSSDANANYSDGHTYCFSCNTLAGASGHQSERPARQPDGLIKEISYRPLVKRKISEEVCKKFGYGVATYRGQSVQVAQYRRDGAVVAQKVRFPDKTFVMLGDAKNCGFYGQHLVGVNKEVVLVTEGEIDALSIQQVLPKCAVVSLPSGAQSAARTAKREAEFLSRFEKVIICFDTDDVGKAAAREFAEVLKPGQAYMMSLTAKDANEMLVAGQQAELINAYYAATPYRPDGIVKGSDLWEKIIEVDTRRSVPWPWEGLNRITHGLRMGELVTLTAGSGVGKSQVCREVAHSLIQQGESIGYIALEENVRRTALGMMGVHLGKPLHLSTEGVTEEELRSAFEATVGSDRVYLYDHFGSLASDNLLNKIRFLAKSCDVSWIILDHLSIVVSGSEYGERDGGERKAIDVLMTNLRSLVEETGIGMILVSHLRRPEGNKGWEDGLQTSLNALRGSASIAQLSDAVIGLERNQQSDSANETTVRVLKNRFSGETGVATSLYYDKATGRMSEENFGTSFSNDGF